MEVDGYIGILIAGIVIVLLTVITIEIVWKRILMTKSREVKSKEDIYECGEIALGDPKFTNINFRYYIYAIIFLVFDVEAVFLFPWAINFLKLGILGFIEAIMFISLIFVALIYAVENKILKFE
ncbi:MAG: NADH-quinone oxidoreductase subunit A [Candidatus Altarchaeaceae archaeon]